MHMTVTDPVADMLTRLRNASAVGKDSVVMPSSRMRRAIADILLQEGYVSRVEEMPGDSYPSLTVYLKYVEGREKEPVLRGLQRVSRPGRRVYAKKDAIPWIRSGLGTAIISTSQGLLTDREARRRGVGGEVLCAVW